MPQVQLFHPSIWSVQRPRSLVNLEDDTSSIWSGIGKSGNYTSNNTQSLDRRKYAAGAFDRAQSMGALNFGYISEDGILRGSVAPFMHFAGNSQPSESKQSLGQFSDHIDKYRDVALWSQTNSPPCIVDWLTFLVRSPSQWRRKVKIVRGAKPPKVGLCNWTRNC